MILVKKPGSVSFANTKFRGEPNPWSPDMKNIVASNGVAHDGLLELIGEA